MKRFVYAAIATAATTCQPAWAEEGVKPAHPTGIVVKLSPELSQAAELVEDPDGGIPREKGEKVKGLSPLFEATGASDLRAVHRGVVSLKKAGKSEGAQLKLLKKRYAKRAKRGHGGPPVAQDRWYRLSVSGDEHALRLVLDRLEKVPGVEAAELDGGVQALLNPDDPYFSSSGLPAAGIADLYGLKNAAFPAAWDTVSGSGVILAVVDTGVFRSHEDLAGRLWTNPKETPDNAKDDDLNGYVDDVNGWDCYNSDNDPTDDHGHGTHVAGTAGATMNNALGVASAAWGTKLMAVKVLNAAGSGSYANVACGIRYAVDNGADVISMSLGGASSSTVLTDALDHARAMGVVVVAAAGNSATTGKLQYPGNYRGVVSVGSVDWNDVRAGSSQGGHTLDVTAPGVKVLSTAGAGYAPAGEKYVLKSGTSMATPHASGLAALLVQKNPTFTVDELRGALRRSATDVGEVGFDCLYGAGRIHAVRALVEPRPVGVTILLPEHGTKAGDASDNGPTVEFRIAVGEGAARWHLDVGIALRDTLPTTWNTITNGMAPGADIPAGTYDLTGRKEPEWHVARLTAEDAAGSEFVDFMGVSVARDPKGTVDTPAEKACVSGKVTVSGTAMDDTGVDKVEFLVADGTGYHNATLSVPGGPSTNWSYAWDTAYFSDELVALSIRLWDPYFNTTTLPYRYVQVSNVAPAISGVTANPTATSVGIAWTTDRKGTSKVEYGTTENLTGSVEDVAQVTAHSVKLTGLSSSTKYYFKVVSANCAGLASSSSVMTFTTAAPDTTAPDTMILTGPPEFSGEAKATFVFQEAGGPDPSTPVTFECAVDAGVWASCSSPHVATVADGFHTFRVRAMDSAGNKDADPATRTWTADTLLPSGGSISYVDGATRIPIAVTWAKGDGTGTAITSWVIERAKKTYDGTCIGALWTYSALVTNPASSPYGDSPEKGCYRYRLVTKDQAGNTTTYAPATTAIIKR